MPSLGNVILIPGFMGTHLDVVPLILPTRRLWVSYPPILSGDIDKLQLAADGQGQVVPAGGVIEPDGLVEEYYEPLGRRLVADGWSAFEIGYDWRKSYLYLGNVLYDKIVEVIGTADYRIVAHSGGGLLARMAWRRAAQLGTTSRIKRMVNLAVPHWGTYSAVMNFAGISDLYRTLSWATSLGAGFRIGGSFSVGGRSDFLDRIIGSWPQLYELLPQVREPDTIDPDRRLLFNKVNWGSSYPRVRADLLANASDVHLALVSLKPPDDILVDVVGRGISTAAALRVGLSGIGQPNGYFYADGDGVVTRAAGQYGGRAAELFSLHADIIRHPEVLSSVTRWLQDGLPASPPVEIHVMPFGDLGPAGLPLPQHPGFGQIFDSAGNLIGGTRLPEGSDERRPSYCP